MTCCHLRKNNSNASYSEASVQADLIILLLFPFAWKYTQIQSKLYKCKHLYSKRNYLLVADTFPDHVANLKSFLSLVSFFLRDANFNVKRERKIYTHPS